ncbi:hypothetical protein FCL43_022615 [Enterobacter hormaechei]|uniref:Uncharacterized protein n=2 Tax=Gammaproteobacteria TaxID=1236 RepID=A0A3S0K9D9_STEMA|nr:MULTISPECIES: hypothetical protein [Bacteria]MDI6438717.1 hypothetical protein [Enterobacter hormaechei]MWR20418.1 hypothetical protein [Helicobacter pylori]RAR28025.1 hypothetical protein DP092_25845 [Pseudomonas sp. MDMC224]RSZ22437.1 hypothetical protein EJ356_11535 [Staphylococcus haemolyticus]SIP65827.1 hypothetical protein BN9982_2380002 [Mycobacterium tuberculosis]SME40855.1 Uncharacterised protein [Klebsiella pneumoniae]
MIPRGSSPSPRRIAVSVAAELLHQIEQPGEEPIQRYHDRLAEAQGVLEVLAPGRWRFRGLTSQHWPHVAGHRLVEHLVLPALGIAWLDLERREWWWMP